MWDLIVSVPDRCLSFYFSSYEAQMLNIEHAETGQHKRSLMK